MPNPVTPAGRVLDVFLELWAISVVATAAASIAAFFHARHLEQAPDGASRLSATAQVAWPRFSR